MSMPYRRSGLRRWLRLPGRSRAELHADIDEELETLLAARIDALVARGMTIDDARVEAATRLGASLDDVRDQLHRSAQLRERRMRFDELLHDLGQDVRYAARGLIRRPAFTALAVLTLAIGIGATTAIFSAVNTLILRPLPYLRPNELMRASLVSPSVGGRPSNTDMSWSYPKAELFRNQQTIFSELAFYTWQNATITSGDAELIRVETVTASYLPLLGVQPALGRNFDGSVDDHPGQAPEAILSDALWRQRFSADPTIVGKTISLDRTPYTIIGVAPEGFLGLTGQGQAFIPVTTASAALLSQKQNHFLMLVGRRKPTVTEAQAASATAVLGRQVNDAFADNFTEGKVWSGTAAPLDASRVAPTIRRSLLILFGAVAFVLLIACVNVANLLIGRASTRRREIAVRLAIGAGRRRLVRLLLTESTLLALVGAAASVFVAWGGIHALAAVNPATLRMPRAIGVGAITFASISLDWSALAFTVGIALVVGLVFGLAPALHATRASLADAMKDGAGSDRARGISVGRRVLVVAEVALALVLLVGSGLMMRSLAKLLSVDPGYDVENVLTLRLTVPQGGLARDSLPGFYTQLLDRLRAIPGVTHAGIGTCPPLGGGCGKTPIDFMDRATVAASQRPLVEINWASSDWFAVGRASIKRGRTFTDADRVGSSLVMVVNETAARKFWPGENPIGKRAGLGANGYEIGAEVIGVVGDIRQLADSAALPAAYVSYNQSPRGSLMIFLRTQRNPDALGPEVRRVLRELAPAFPVNDMQSLAQRASGVTSQARFSATLLALFAATALSLAVVGIYGVMSLAVAARTREIGIRIALGADHKRVQRLVVGEGVALVSIGAVIGLVGAILATRLLATLLFDIAPTDPATYAAILAVLAGAAVLASWIPARRASRVDPVEALRAD